MNKIIVEHDDYTLTVVEENGVITVYEDGEESEAMRSILDGMVAGAPPMGGTYYPEPGTMLAYYNALKSVNLGKVIVMGDIGEIPYEDGVIY